MLKHLSILERLYRLELVVASLSDQWLNRCVGPMTCTVCGGPATVQTPKLEQGTHTALCDEDKGNRVVEEDFRAIAIRRLKKFLNYVKSVEVAGFGHEF